MNEMNALGQLVLSDTDVELSFNEAGDLLERQVEVGGVTSNTVVRRSIESGSVQASFFRSLLDHKPMYPLKGTKRRVSYIDLFCGGGGLSLGVHEALQSMGYVPKLAFAADLDPKALSLVDEHFSPNAVYCGSVEDLVQYEIDYSGRRVGFISEPTAIHEQFGALNHKVDLLVGGPPCQGHSNLNNRTRRSDPRNLLYFTMPAVAVALNVPHVIIENVRSIVNADENVVEISRSIFRAHGYNVEEIVLNAADLGVGQTRVRHFMVASKAEIGDVHSIVAALKHEVLTFKDINGSLQDVTFPSEMFVKNGELSSENQKRVSFLHDNNLYNLPNSERPDCHQEDHSYPSVYGRMYLDDPAPTITTGFGTPGRGRYVHPTERRTVTCREAARIQAFPDWYWKANVTAGFSRKDFQKIIGDAVPANMVLPLVLALGRALA